MKKLLLFLTFVSVNIIHGQLIVNNTTQTPAQLVQNVLLGSGITVSNIKFNGTAAGATTVSDQVGMFTNGNTTNIGLTSGIILATGSAQVAVGPNNDDGSLSNIPPANPITADADLAALAGVGVNNIKNKAVLEFDFVPTGTSLSFNFVFASEEYPEWVNAGVNDSFGFFISGPGITGPYSGALSAANIAVVPGTSIPISIDTVNATTNSTYFVDNGDGSTPAVNTSIQYDGFTTVIAALATVQCGQTYHIKLAIANVSDNLYDSAVFIQANSFNTNPLTLPPDDLVSNHSAPCPGTPVQICSSLANTIPQQWTLNGVSVPGTGSCITATQPGTYCVTASPSGSGCPQTACMVLEYLPPMPIANPPDITVCTGSTFNLSLNTPIILNGSPVNNYIITYHHSLADAQNINNPIANTTTYPGVAGEIIWVAIQDNWSGQPCVETRSFHLVFANNIPPVITCGASTATSVQFNWNALSGTTDYTVSYQINANPIVNVGSIGNVTTYTVSGLIFGENVTITLTPVGGAGTCFGPASLTCTTLNCPTITTPSANQIVCMGGDPTAFSVTTTSVGANAISYVYFATPQAGNAMYTGGIPLGSATPNASGVASYDAPVLGNAGSLPNIAGTYAVYAIINPTPADPTCRPYQLIQVTVNP